MSMSFSSNKLRVPPGFEHVLEGLAREILREQPSNIVDFAANYFRKKLQERDGGMTESASTAVDTLPASDSAPPEEPSEPTSVAPPSQSPQVAEEEEEEEGREEVEEENDIEKAKEDEVDEGDEAEEGEESRGGGGDGGGEGSAVDDEEPGALSSEVALNETEEKEEEKEEGEANEEKVMGGEETEAKEEEEGVKDEIEEVVEAQTTSGSEPGNSADGAQVESGREGETSLNIEAGGPVSATSQSSLSDASGTHEEGEEMGEQTD